MENHPISAGPLVSGWEGLVVEVNATPFIGRLSGQVGTYYPSPASYANEALHSIAHRLSADQEVVVEKKGILFKAGETRFLLQKPLSSNPAFVHHAMPQYTDTEDCKFLALTLLGTTIVGYVVIHNHRLRTAFDMSGADISFYKEDRLSDHGPLDQSECQDRKGKGTSSQGSTGVLQGEKSQKQCEDEESEANIDFENVRQLLEEMCRQEEQGLLPDEMKFRSDDLAGPSSPLPGEKFDPRVDPVYQETPQVPGQGVPVARVADPVGIHTPVPQQPPAVQVPNATQQAQVPQDNAAPGLGRYIAPMTHSMLQSHVLMGNEYHVRYYTRLENVLMSGQYNEAMLWGTLCRYTGAFWDKDSCAHIALQNNSISGQGGGCLKSSCKQDRPSRSCQKRVCKVCAQALKKFPNVQRFLTNHGGQFGYWLNQ
jgi:hypothetical protein